MKPGELLLLYIVALNGYALLLIYLRAWLNRVPLYRPMVWNFFLSVLPLGILLVVLIAAGLTDAFVGRGIAIGVGAIGLLVWLLALPNSSYLITELNLNHRREDDPVPLWYDIVAVLSFAMSGVVNMIFGVLIVQIGFVAAVYGDADNAAIHSGLSRALPPLIILAVSVGIYLGRYLRLNSWDVRSPQRLWAKVRDHFDSPAALGGCALFCVTHTTFLWLMYGLIVGPLLDSLADQG
ncbi:DUF1361 domain-containing protein [Nocardia sp. NBC_01327]|uniref:DUF1361 domain-containing protein n=1 Tax=Nocardia sp. NBC_01327 TaxID=2903593 RepID=UPI002E0FEB67|nr:DUF1361 domain-containing protein [Nocardia sp. NBC_01327]